MFHSTAIIFPGIFRDNVGNIVFSGLLIILSTAASAHHSFAPHFDRDKPVTISGTITEYEKRNPHSYLSIRAEDASGMVKEWRCDTHGYTQLARNGITPDMLSEGSRVGISGSQHRRDETMCFFDMLYLEDGRELSVNGPRNRPEEEEEQRDSIFGTWQLMQNTSFTSSGPQAMMKFLTPTGRAATAQYNPITDDPAYRCEPVAIRRAWAAPSTPLSISRRGDNILIKHEWMDIERIIHMNQYVAPERTEPTILGYSVGRFDGDALVIETSHFSVGVINQYVTIEGQPLTGVLHSDALTSIERVSFDDKINRLMMSLDQVDNVFFSSPFPTYSREYQPSNIEIQPFGCIPEILK